MTRSQRILVGVSLPLLAWLLHVNLCEWVFKEQRLLWNSATSTFSQLSILTYREDPPPLPPPTTTRPAGRAVQGQMYTGLLTEYWVDKWAAIVFGVTLPIALLLTDAYLMLGWRRQSRIQRGLCAKCGYDMRGSKDGPCPECGNRKAA